MDARNLRPSGRLMKTPNAKKSSTKAGDGKVILSYFVRSRIVYENKGYNDTMSDEKSGICGKLTRILRTKAAL
jgi:hypothetical protein